MTKRIALFPGWLMFIILMSAIILGSILKPLFGNPFFFFIYAVWLYSLGKEAQNQNSQELAIHLNRLKSTLLYPIAYAVGADLYWDSLMPYLVPFHILAMGCVFYSFFFIAKSIRNAELKRSASIDEWKSLFMGLWFFPIGVWNLQKRMKNILQ